jgi:hypothetical protein
MLSIDYIPKRSKSIAPLDGKKAGLLRGACHRERIRAARWLAMTSSHNSAIPRRDAPESCINPSRPKGRGECRAPSAPAASCAKVEVECTRVVQVHRNHPASPHAMVYGLLRALPGDRAFLSPSPRGYWHLKPGRVDAPPRDLTPASRRQDHTIWPSTAAPFVCAPGDRSRKTALQSLMRAGTAASTASRPASMTMANAPLWDGMANHIA